MITDNGKTKTQKLEDSNVTKNVLGILEVSTCYEKSSTRLK
jgi:hypothetical protein